MKMKRNLFQCFNLCTCIQSNSVSGRNVYGILRAGRALGTESIVLSSPYLSHNLEKNHYGVAVMLALIEYFKSEIKLCFLCK